MAKKDVYLTIEGLSKSFGNNRVLKDVSLTIKKGSVLGLMGENGAGKSTLMKCLFGIYTSDSGKIVFMDDIVTFNGPKDALERGVAMVHQELNQCLDRSIADNMYMGRFPGRCGVVNKALLNKKCEEVFAMLNLPFSPSTIMGTMSVSERQMVEIAKAMSYGAKIIILDEPTSSLSEKETDVLFKLINKLKDTGVSFVFISHKMEEIFTLCDDIVVLRDGLVTMNKPIKDTNLDEVVMAMIGRSMESRFPKLTNKVGEAVLEVKDLSTKYEPTIKNVNFTLHKGEILGVYGLVGAGRSELLETIFGLRTVSSGAIIYQGRRLHLKSNRDAIRENFAFVGEERKVSGLFAQQTLKFNNCITFLDYFKENGVLKENKMNKSTEKQLSEMKVKCMGKEDLISSLSGGNQQKVIIGKWLQKNPDILILDEPTRGIDIMAKYQVYDLIHQLAKQGKSIIISSSEMPEIMGVTNNILVMSNHRLAGIIPTKEANEEKLMKLCYMYL